MTKTTRVIAWISGIFLLLIVVAIIIIATFDWNRLKPTINQKVSTELNRPFAIRGDLGVVWERQKAETGWRSWVPWPHVHADDIILGNPPDIPDVTMVHLPRVEATLAPLALLTKTVYLPWIKLQQPDARLIRLSEKNNNWTFNLASDGEKDPNAQPSSWSFRLDNILFDRGRIAIDDKVSKADVEILVDPLGKPLPLSDLSTHIILKNADLRLQPLKFGMAGGTISSNIHLEGDKKPMQGRAEIQARRLKLKELMPDVELMQKTLGEMNGDADIRGVGNSVAALLGSGNGNLKLLMNDGLISRNLMEILGLNVGNFIIGQIFGDDEVRVNCAAANVDLVNGVARPQLFAFDTENAVINVTGTASMASEQLDLTIDPESKGIRIITLRSPLYVRGTFKNPQAGVKPGPLIARGAVAAALATLVTPAAALLALISPSEGDANQCRNILSQMKK